MAGFLSDVGEDIADETKFGSYACVSAIAPGQFGEDMVVAKGPPRGSVRKQPFQGLGNPETVFLQETQSNLQSIALRFEQDQEKTEIERLGMQRLQRFFGREQSSMLDYVDASPHSPAATSPAVSRIFKEEAEGSEERANSKTNVGLREEEGKQDAFIEEDEEDEEDGKEDEEDDLFKVNAVNEVESERDRATPAWETQPTVPRPGQEGDADEEVVVEQEEEEREEKVEEEARVDENEKKRGGGDEVQRTYPGSPMSAGISISLGPPSLALSNLDGDLSGIMNVNTWNEVFRPLQIDNYAHNNACLMPENDIAPMTQEEEEGEVEQENWWKGSEEESGAQETGEKWEEDQWEEEDSSKKNQLSCAENIIARSDREESRQQLANRPCKKELGGENLRGERSELHWRESEEGEDTKSTSGMDKRKSEEEKQTRERTEADRRAEASREEETRQKKTAISPQLRRRQQEWDGQSVQDSKKSRREGKEDDQIQRTNMEEDVKIHLAGSPSQPTKTRSSILPESSPTFSANSEQKARRSWHRRTTLASATSTFVVENERDKLLLHIARSNQFASTRAGSSSHSVVPLAIEHTKPTQILNRISRLNFQHQTSDAHELNANTIVPTPCDEVLHHVSQSVLHERLSPALTTKVLRQLRATTRTAACVGSDDAFGVDICAWNELSRWQGIWAEKPSVGALDARSACSRLPKD